MSDDNHSPVEDNAQDLKIEDFANQQLAKALTSLRVTQLITGVVALLAVFYVYVYSQLKPWLDPKHLSNEALVLVQTHVNENARNLSSRLLTELPRVLTNGIAKLKAQIPVQYAEDADRVAELLGRAAKPDSDLAQQFIDDMPKYREEVEMEVSKIFVDHTERALGDLTIGLDRILEEHKVQVAKLMENNQDEQALEAISKEMETHLKGILLDQRIDNETASDKISESLKFLDHISRQMAHLAHAENLSDDELRTRRAIAVILDKTRFVRPEAPEGGLDLNSDSPPKQTQPPSVPEETGKKAVPSKTEKNEPEPTETPKPAQPAKSKKPAKTKED